MHQQVLPILLLLRVPSLCFLHPHCSTPLHITAGSRQHQCRTSLRGFCFQLCPHLIPSSSVAPHCLRLSLRVIPAPAIGPVCPGHHPTLQPNPTPPSRPCLLNTSHPDCLSFPHTCGPPSCLRTCAFSFLSTCSVLPPALRPVTQLKYHFFWEACTGHSTILGLPHLFIDSQSYVLVDAIIALVIVYHHPFICLASLSVFSETVCSARRRTLSVPSSA